uniref:Type IV pili methyl-accepting chemotaxis transducer N-terminal domain-containing protein n=1 Tax=Desertifilum tharense IPPAS B-1220 TaxID=1781255 RepID=A0ACD5GTG7_9CYAN
MSSESPLHFPKRRLAALYIAALGAIAILSLLGHAWIERSLNQQLYSTHTLSLVSRQLTLGEKLTKSAIALQHASTPELRQAYRAELETTFTLWRDTHQTLQTGDPQQHLPPPLTPEIRRQWEAIAPSYQTLLQATQEILETPPTPIWVAACKPCWLMKPTLTPAWKRSPASTTKPPANTWAKFNKFSAISSMRFSPSYSWKDY